MEYYTIFNIHVIDYLREWENFITLGGRKSTLRIYVCTIPILLQVCVCKSGNVYQRNTATFLTILMVVV